MIINGKSFTFNIDYLLSKSGLINAYMDWDDNVTEIDLDYLGLDSETLVYALENLDKDISLTPSNYVKYRKIHEVLRLTNKFIAPQNKLIYCYSKRKNLDLFQIEGFMSKSTTKNLFVCDLNSFLGGHFVKNIKAYSSGHYISITIGPYSLGINNPVLNDCRKLVYSMDEIWDYFYKLN